MPSETVPGTRMAGRSADRPPRVSIGLPVYNGATYLEAALDSFLAQSFGDFELIISDNASTDATPSICRAYAGRDSRIRYSRLERNIGGFPNHNRVVELATGEYFAWGAHDDLRSPTWLARCVQWLDGDPGAVLCFSRVGQIDEQGAPVPEKALDFGADSPDPGARWRALVTGGWVYDPIYGLVRLAALRQTGLLRSYSDSDRVLLAELAVRGRFHRLDEVLFFRRLHPGQSTRVYPSRRTRVAWFKPSRADATTFPFLRMGSEWCLALARAPVPWRLKRRCFGVIWGWTLEHRLDMREDLVQAARRAVKRMTGWFRSSHEAVSS